MKTIYVVARKETLLRAFETKEDAETFVQWMKDYWGSGLTFNFKIKEVAFGNP